MNLRNVKELHWNLINIIFHPLFISLYCVVFLLQIHPELFAKNTKVAKDSLVINTVITMVIMPLVAVFLMYKLKFVESIYLHHRKERIGPVFIFTVFTFFYWAFILLKNPANQETIGYDYAASKNYLKNFVGYPKLVIRMGLAFFLSTAITLVANAFFKISLHTIGGGLLLGFSIGQALQTNSNFMYIPFAVVITILLFGARNKTGSHTKQELVAGFVLGLNVMLGCLLIAY